MTITNIKTENPCIKCIVYTICRNMILSKVKEVLSTLSRVKANQCSIIHNDMPAYTVEHLIAYELSEVLYKRCQLIDDYHKMYSSSKYAFIIFHLEVTKDAIETFKLEELLDEGYLYC